MKLLILDNVWVSGRAYSAGDVVEITNKDEYQTLLLGRTATDDRSRIIAAEKSAAETKPEAKAAAPVAASEAENPREKATAKK